MPDEPEAAALRGLGQRALDLEAHAVVDDLQLDRAAARTHAHGDVRRAGVLAHVRERLLNGAEHRDALRGARASPDRHGSRALRAMPVRSVNVVDLAVQDLAERAADDALRLERVRDLAELTIELDEPSREVVEAAVRLLAMSSSRMNG